MLCSLQFISYLLKGNISHLFETQTRKWVIGGEQLDYYEETEFFNKSHWKKKWQLCLWFSTEKNIIKN